MLAKVQSFVLIGVDPLLCEIEIDCKQRGLDKTVVVGLAQAAVKEAIERVRRSILNSGFAWTAHGALINLAPADVKKEGPALDLPMAIGVLRGTNFIQSDVHKNFLIAGELALDGRVRKIKGGLSMALLAKRKKMRGVILPEENAREAAVVDGIEVYPVANLAQAVSFLNEQLPLEPFELDGEAYEASKIFAAHDFADVRGQEAVKRAIAIAAAGSHNLLTLCPVLVTTGIGRWDAHESRGRRRRSRSRSGRRTRRTVSRRSSRRRSFSGCCAGVTGCTVNAAATAR